MAPAGHHRWTSRCARSHEQTPAQPAGPGRTQIPTSKRGHDEVHAADLRQSRHREQFFGPEGKALGAEINALIAELTASGELVGGEALADPAQTRSIRPKDGAPVITDGPLAEAKEHFGGYLIVDCETPERATEIASRWPNARFAAMEVRPIMNAGGGQDM